MRIAAVAFAAAALLDCVNVAHAAPLEVRDVAGRSGAGPHFPAIAGGNAKAVERINQALFIGNLSQMAPRPGDPAPALDGMS
jgi:hypothetical protein